MTNPQIIAALSQLTDAVRSLTERQIIGEGTQRQTNKDLEALTRAVERLSDQIDPVAGHYRDQEAVVKARAQLHQEAQAQRRAVSDALAPIGEILRHPLAYGVVMALIGAFAAWLGLSPPADTPTAIMQNAGSALTRAKIGPRGQG
jgi:hypothetical protein